MDTKTRDQREGQLLRLMRTEQGNDLIFEMYEKIIGSDPPIGTPVRQEMIAVILDHEFGKL